MCRELGISRLGGQHARFCTLSTNLILWSESQEQRDRPGPTEITTVAPWYTHSPKHDPILPRWLFYYHYLPEIAPPERDGISEVVQEKSKHFMILNTRGKANAIRVNISLGHMGAGAFAYQLKKRFERRTAVGRYHGGPGSHIMLEK